MPTPFENVKSQIGYCGLWCGSCIVGNGTLVELTKRYEQLIKGYGIDEWGAKNFNGEEFIRSLHEIQKIPICPGCLKNGGNEGCMMRPCAMKKRLKECSSCEEYGSCPKTESMEKVRKGALAVGMLIKPPKGDQKKIIKKWTREYQSQFPFCLNEPVR